VHIDRGSIGDVRMDGVNWLQVGLGFGESTATNWVVVYIDDKATDAQAKALQGWMEAGMKELNPKKLPYLAGAFAGFKTVPMTWQSTSDRESYLVKVPGVLDLQVKAIRNPGHPEPVTSTGVLDDFGNSFVHSDTIKHEYKDPSLPKYDGWDLRGRQSNYAHFVIGSGVTKPYTVGWGCWSAHKDFQTDGNYQERLLNHPKK